MHLRKDAGSLVVDDLLQGMNEWRNIQDVIRSTFKALHDVIKAQGDAVKTLERQMETKASITDVQVIPSHRHRRAALLLPPRGDGRSLQLRRRRSATDPIPEPVISESRHPATPCSAPAPQREQMPGREAPQPSSHAATSSHAAMSSHEAMISHADMSSHAATSPHAAMSSHAAMMFARSHDVRTQP
jgi:hypothetical protein